VNEHPNVSGTARSKENPVVGISTVSGITIKEIIAGNDVKAKDIGKSGDFQVGERVAFRWMPCSPFLPLPSIRCAVCEGMPVGL